MGENKEYKNDAFTVQAEERPGCLLDVHVAIAPEQTKKIYKKATKTINKQISIPGFRKGHAPDSAVISRYNSYVESEWKELLVNEALRAALDLSKIYPLNKESVQRPKIESCTLEDGATVHFLYEHYPNIPAIEFSQLSLPTFEKEPISEEKLEEILKDIQKANADWENVEGRGVKKGDFVDLTIVSLDEEPPKPIVTDRRFEVEENRMAPWMKKLIMGLEVGNQVEGVSEVEKNAEESVRKNFKPTRVRITLNGIKKIILPEVDDELAKKVRADSKEDLIQKIKENLNKEAEDEQKQKYYAALDEALLNTYQFEIPASIFEAERKERIRNKIQELKSKQVPDDEIKSQESHIEKETSQIVDRSIRLYFLHKQIAKQGKISITNQELNQELTNHINQYPYLYGKDMDKETSENLISRLASSLMQQKSKDYALDQIMGSHR